MKTPILILALALGAAALGGCNRHQDNGGVSAEESEQLNNAAAMLDASPDTLAATNDMSLGNDGTDVVPADEGAAGNGADPD